VLTSVSKVYIFNPWKKRIDIKSYFEHKFILHQNTNDIINEVLEYNKIDPKFLKINNQIKNDFLNKEVKIKNGILLYGPPGSGKNYILKLLANYHQAYIGEFTIEDIESNEKIEITNLKEEIIKYCRNNKIYFCHE
jgi:SpoVK/Ycf46/Vps4 family AAA+-type ATPase